jgi:hypothetical protein
MPRTFWATVAVLVLLGVRPSFAFDFFYADLADSRRQLIMREDSISIRDTVAPAQYCAASSDYFCFSGGGLRFAVPKKLTANTKTWKQDGTAYRIQDRTKFSIIGVPVDVVFIERSSKGEKYVFVFSEARGIIALSIVGKTSRTFVLENPCGFGASADCRNSR